MSASFTRSMTATDSVLWAIERDPELRSTVTAIGVLDRAPDRDVLRDRMKAAMQAVPRLRQRVLEPRFGLGHPRWIDDQSIDMDYHLRAVAALPGDDRWLLDFAGSLAESGFDRNRPLWEFVVVEGLPGGRAALVQKVHHSLTDGVGGVELMQSMLDWSRHPGRVPSLHPAEAPQVLTGWRRIASPAVHLPRTLLDALPAVTHGAADPVGSMIAGWRTSGSMARLLAPGRQRMSPIFVGRSTNWRFDIHEEPLEALRCAGTEAQGTINDVFVAALAGGLQRYHLKQGHEVAALRLTLPVSLRRPGDPPGGNRFTPVRFALPIAELDPAARVRQVGALCRQWRQEPALPLSDSVASVLSLLPRPATTAVMGSLLKGVDVVATNVRGVPRPCYIAGAKLTREFAFAPPSGAALNAALVSHAGTACVGVSMDKGAVADPDLFMACLREAFAELIHLGHHHHQER
jgi:WS/DGAT/MGAT family acyltransferase